MTLLAEIVTELTPPTSAAGLLHWINAVFFVVAMGAVFQFYREHVGMKRSHARIDRMLVLLCRRVDVTIYEKPPEE